MEETLNFQVERLFELETFSEAGGGFAKVTLPIGDLRIAPLEPGEVFCPFIGLNKEVGEIPFVGVGKIGAGEDFGGHERRGANVQRPTSNVQRRIADSGAAVYDRRSFTSASMAGWRAIRRMALPRRPRPGGIRCQGEAPEGCGKGIRSKARRWSRMAKRRPTTSSSFSKGRN